MKNRNNASLAICEIVKENRRYAKSAEDDFDHANRMIQIKTRSSIDLFGSSATSEAVSIAYDARNACEELYSAYQMLVENTDERCKELLYGNPDAEAIKEVADFIKWLNDESAIENNFSASLNSVDLGNFASVKYSAPIHSRIIQREWEKRYDSLPEAKMMREKRAEEAKKLAIKRKEEEERRKKEEEDKDKKIKEKHDTWETEKNGILKKRERILKDSISKRENELSAEIEQKKNDAIAKEESIIEAMNLSIDYAKTQLNNSSFFSFSEKKKWKKEIAVCEIAIENSVKAIEEAKNEFTSDKEMLKEILSSFKTEEEERIKEEYPIPAEPEKPKTRAQKLKEQGNAGLMTLIYESMKPGTKYTVSEIHGMIPELQECSVTKVSALVRGLKLDARLKRTEYLGKTYFERCED